MRRHLVLDDGSRPVPVAVTFDGHGPVDAAADGLATLVGREPGRWSLWCDRLSVRPLVDLDLAELRDGDVVVLGARGWRRPRPGVVAARLAVSGGGGAGTTWELRPGSHVIGRGPEAEVRLDDPGVSRTHAVLEVADDGGVTLCDLEPVNPSSVDGAVADHPVAVAPDSLIEVGDTTLRLLPSRREGAVTTARADGDEVNRAPRRSLATAPTLVSLPAPPEAVRARRLPRAAVVAPLLTSVAAALIFASPPLLLLALLSPIAYLWQAVEDRRGERGEHTAAVDRWRDQVLRRAGEARVAADAWAVALRSTRPDPAEVADRMTTRSAELWERRPGDADFLHLRVGWGDDHLSPVVVEPGGEPDLAAWAATVLTPAGVVHGAPVTVDLGPGTVLGVCGDPATTMGVARALLLQAAALHSPSELRLAAIVADAGRGAWLNFLPHTTSADAPLVAAATDAAATAAAAPTEVDELVERLVAAVRDNVAAAAVGRLSGTSAPVVVVIDGDVVGAAALEPLLRGGAPGGASVVWLARERRQLPNACTVVLDVTDPRAGTLSRPGGAGVRTVVPDVVDEAVALRAAASIASLRDGTQRDARRLPGTVTLLDTVGVADGASVLERWATSTGLQVPLGRTAEGDFVVDLRRDGPHVLVGGTTGSGKSELLQAFVAGLAAWNPPSRVTFLLIDYKGGAAFSDCLALPHTVGMVTDLDGQLAHRALVSLGAELRWREHLLAHHGAKDLVHLERSNPDAAPPALVIVVDEFATLVNELPEFVDGVVNIAQRGRSLGIHLVLATQRPAGAVNDNIRANTNLRIALRMNDAADSDDVIGSAGAAALPRSVPGRAFARTGHGELAELQVAFAGTRRPGPGVCGPVAVERLRAGTRPSPDGSASAREDAGPTDLQVVVAACRAAAGTGGLAPQRRPWLDPLPSLLTRDELPVGTGAGAAIGLVDLPDEQRQTALRWDPATDGSLLVWGAPGSGKTTLLRTLALALAQDASPAEVQVHVVDYASRGLGSLADLPHCATVVSGDDPERVERLFRHLEQVVTRRQLALGAVNAADLDEHNGAVAPRSRLARIVVLLDGFAAFRAAFEDVDFGALLDRLPRLMSDGRSCGVHLVLTGDGRSAFPLPITSVTCARFALRLNELEDYGWIGFDTRAIRALPAQPGRAVLPDGRQVQLAVVDALSSAAAQSAAVTRAGRDLGARHPGTEVVGVPAFPAVVDASSLPAYGPLVAPIGVGVATDSGVELVVATADLRRGHLAVAGPPGSGRTTALAALARGLADHAEVHVLAGFDGGPGSDAHRVGRVVSDGVLAELDGACVDGSVRSPLVVIVDDADHVSEAHLGRLEDLVGAADGGRTVRLVVAGRTASLARAYGGVLATVLADGHLLLLDPGPAEADLAGVAMPRRGRRANPRGRAILVRDGRVQALQVATTAAVAVR